MKSNKYGKNKDAFTDIADLMSRQSFQFLRLVKTDRANLRLTFLVYDERLYAEKKLNQLYIDGTFKTKFLSKDIHYNVLVFAKNLKTSLKTVPIAFIVSFDGTNERYLDCYKCLVILWKKLNVDASHMSILSDLG